MRKIFLLLSVMAAIIVVVFGWYLRASIYWKLEDAHVQQPSNTTEHTIGKISSIPDVTYAAIGDSLTAGVGVDTYLASYPYLLAQKIAGDATQVFLKPFAIPGVRSIYVLNNFIEPVIASNPDIITLFIGVNDIHGNVPVKQFEEHYRVILTRLTKETQAQIVVINLPYIGTSDLISLPYRLYFNWQTQQYNKTIKKLAQQYDVTYINLYAAHEPIALDTTYYADDLFHPNALGYAKWAQAIYADIGK